MQGVVDVNVSSGSRVRRLDFFVDWAHIAGVECCLDSFFLDYFVFDIIFFLLDIVLARPWVLVEGLPSVRCFTFVFPELASLCFSQETLRFLRHHISIFTALTECFRLDGQRVSVSSRPRFVSLLLSIFAIGDLRHKNAVLPSLVEFLLT